MSDTGKWTIGYQDKKHKNYIESEYQSDTQLNNRWKDFERDVAQNPFYHPKPNRIRKLKDTSYEGMWRYRKDPIRVVYYPDKSSKTVYPIEVATTTDISYKKRSSK